MKQIKPDNRANPSPYKHPNHPMHHENKLSCTSRTSVSPSEDQWKFGSGK